MSYTPCELIELILAEVFRTMAFRAPSHERIVAIASLTCGLVALLLPGVLGAQGRDSAGVRIIETTTPQFTGARAWRLSPQPILSLGGGLPDAADEIELGGQAPIELSDGRFAVMHVRAKNVRIYTRAGALQYSVGRPGEGPNEFKSMAQLFPGRGDTVVVRDIGNNRLTWVTPSGTVSRTLPFRVRVPNLGYGALMSDVLTHTFRDGSLALLSWPIWSNPPRPMQFDDSLLVLRCALPACAQQSIVRTAGFRAVLTTARLDQSRPIPYGPHTEVAFSGDRIYVAQEGRPNIEEYSPDGRLRRILRLQVPKRPITEAFVRQRRAAARVKPDRWEKMSDNAKEQWELGNANPRPFPSHFSPISRLFADREGGVYALESDDPTQPKTLAAFSPTGAFLARIPIPDGIMIRTVSRDIVYATRVDDDGFTHLMLYRILKP